MDYPEGAAVFELQFEKAEVARAAAEAELILDDDRVLILGDEAGDQVSKGYTALPNLDNLTDEEVEQLRDWWATDREGVMKEYRKQHSVGHALVFGASDRVTVDALGAERAQRV